MTNFVFNAVTPILAEIERLLERAMLQLWMSSLREQLRSERGGALLRARLVPRDPHGRTVHFS